MISVDAADSQIRFLTLAWICGGFTSIVVVAAIAFVLVVFVLPLLLSCFCLDIDALFESATEHHDF